MTSRAQALRVTEAIELLLDAGQWQPANDLYQARCGNGQVWMTPARGAAGAAHGHRVRGHPRPPRRLRHPPHPRRLSFYLNEAGLFATDAGDLATARDYLTLAVRHDRDAGDMRNLAAGLRNLAACLGRLGLAGPAREAAAEALTSAEAADDRDNVRDAHAYLGWLAGLAGDTTAAEQHFTTADQICLTDDPTAITCTRLTGCCGRSGWPGPGGAARPGT